MSKHVHTRYHRFTRELSQLLWFVLLGVFFLPLAIFYIGQSVFGDYAGSGFGSFYSNLHGELRAGQPVVIFLLLSPYLVWLLLRLTIWGFRRNQAKDRLVENRAHAPINSE